MRARFRQGRRGRRRCEGTLAYRSRLLFSRRARAAGVTQKARLLPILQGAISRATEISDGRQSIRFRIEGTVQSRRRLWRSVRQGWLLRRAARPARQERSARQPRKRLVAKRRRQEQMTAVPRTASVPRALAVWGRFICMKHDVDRRALKRRFHSGGRDGGREPRSSTPRRRNF